MEDALRQQICRLIAGLIVTDDDFDEREDAFLDRLLARFGIPQEERDSIFPIVDRSEAADAMQALSPEAQQEAMILLIEAAAADGKIVAEERAYLDIVAAVIHWDALTLEAKIKEFLS